MSQALLIVQAINSARRSLGDLVKTIVLRSMASQSYVDGAYVKQYNDRSVDVIPDKFSYHEQQMEDYQQTDVKLLVFNPNNDITITKQDLMVWGDRELTVIQADPSYVGSYIPAWAVVLRK